MTRQDTRITIFRNRLREEHRDAYARSAAAMDARVRTMPGFVAAKTFTADDGERVTIAEFASAADHERWASDAEHADAQRQGIERFYGEYDIAVCLPLTRRRWRHRGSA